MSGLCRNKQITCWNVYPLSGDAPMRVGSRDASVDGWFTGWFDEIAIFSRKLNASEVSDLFHQKL